MTSTNKLFLDHFCLRTVKKFAFESFFYFRVTTRNCITDDHAIGRGREMFALISVRDVDAQSFEHRRHWWIDVQVRSSDVMTSCLEHTGEGSHRCSANSD